MDNATPCAVDGCDRPSIKRGWCSMHYNRWQRSGDPGPASCKRPPTPDLWELIDRAESDGCWLWVGRRDEKGYGRYYGNGRPHQAHRYIYELLVGPIGAGLEIDHLCKVTACVNPDHLEPVTRRENLARSSNPAGIAIRDNTCIRGHLLVEENVYRSPSRPKSRRCRTCLRERRQRHQAA